MGQSLPVISPLRLLGEGSKLGGERPRSLRDRLGDRSATLNFCYDLAKDSKNYKLSRLGAQSTHYKVPKDTASQTTFKYFRSG